MGWSASDFDGLRDNLGHGVRYVPLIAGKPDVGVNIPQGVERLTLQNQIANPLLGPALETFQKMQTVRKELPEGSNDVDLAKRLREVDPEAIDNLFETLDKVTRWQDSILAAIVVDPPWCPMDEVPPGYRPDGKLCIYDLSPDERRAGVNLVFEETDKLVPFRNQPSSPQPPLHGRGLRGSAKRVGIA